MPAPTTIDTPPSPGLPELLGRGHFNPKPSILLKDYVVNASTSSTPPIVSLSSSLTSGPPTSVSGITHSPNTTCLSQARFSVGHAAFLAAITASNDPKSYREAFLDDIWNDSMTDEYTALEANHTWDVTSLPPGKKAIACQWLYKTKFDAQGNETRKKSRLVACGNRQREGLDYTDTFVPVAKPTTVRLFLKLAATHKWELHQMDVCNAFLHGDLKEEVYMKMPPRFQDLDLTKVCRLRKSIYGLKQSPRCWFEKLSTALKSYGFKQSRADYSHFYFIKGDISLHILIYVDDFIIACNDLSTLHCFKNYLHQCFHMKDLGKLKYFLGIEVARNEDGIFLSQRKYALDLITDAGLLESKPSSVPIELNHKLLLSASPLLTDPARYRRLIGRLIYLTFTRPDLCYAVHVLSQCMQRPRQDHWDAALRTVRYIHGSPSQGILLRVDSDLCITAYCDADWNTCPISRRSISAYIVQLGQSPISWKTKKQKTVSMSSAKAEYRSMAFTLKELKWIKQLLTPFGINHHQPMRLYCDSKSAIYIAANPVFHERTRHVESDCHFVRDAVMEKLITTEHIKTKEQPADILTKALPSTTFAYLLSKLDIHNLSLPT